MARALWVDRVFSLERMGVVVTGTLPRRRSSKPGDSLLALPFGAKVVVDV